MSLAVFINLFGAGVLSLFVPALQTRLKSLGLFELFAQVTEPRHRNIFINSNQWFQCPRIRPDIHIRIRNETRTSRKA
jgi:hypothetical protein